MATEVGFEPTDVLPPPVFRTGAISQARPLRHLNPTLFELHIGQQQTFVVGEVGVEPTQPEGNGFTVRPSSPTLAFPNKVRVKGVEPSNFSVT